MAAPFAQRLYGWRPNGYPNVSDKDNQTSVELAAGVNDSLEVTRVSHEKGQTLGSNLEAAVWADLCAELQEGHESSEWRVRRNVVISDFNQFAHLAEAQKAVDRYPVLRTALGMDYLIKLDVAVSVASPLPHAARDMLHAAVSCKWSIRSDRVQNTRHEFLKMVHNRRARTPHLICVTAEPLPSRLAAIARGTGEVDATYHIAFWELHKEAMALPSGNLERDIWQELTLQGRLLPYESLVDTLLHS
ncbi:NgoMIV restriction enzyme [Geodermatophilus saharensis]|uniref:NgoMIV restriction enzyme n=1 Tax=Geodermatophilus saharensis TaxID=1137994 RepID=A0A239EFX0_9ACTN|nr:NgoMIV family type II restriction endonuclease [Geodermatophilus saharensis]SNS43449.1 NgoMIV restriction enzyme [Geodermatophilus saharensis]